jgi:hypothetical protein
MSAGFVGGVIGATIGFFLGNPALGWAIGSGLASALNGTPNRKGPRLSDLQPSPRNMAARLRSCSVTKVWLATSCGPHR